MPTPATPTLKAADLFSSLIGHLAVPVLIVKVWGARCQRPSGVWRRVLLRAVTRTLTNAMWITVQGIAATVYAKEHPVGHVIKLGFTKRPNQDSLARKKPTSAGLADERPHALHIYRGLLLRKIPAWWLIDITEGYVAQEPMKCDDNESMMSNGNTQPPSGTRFESAR